MDDNDKFMLALDTQCLQVLGLLRWDSVHKLGPSDLTDQGKAYFK